MTLYMINNTYPENHVFDSLSSKNMKILLLRKRFVIPSRIPTISGVVDYMTRMRSLLFNHD